MMLQLGANIIKHRPHLRAGFTSGHGPHAVLELNHLRVRPKRAMNSLDPTIIPRTKQLKSGHHRIGPGRLDRRRRPVERPQLVVELGVVMIVELKKNLPNHLNAIVGSSHERDVPDFNGKELEKERTQFQVQPTEQNILLQQGSIRIPILRKEQRKRMDPARHLSRSPRHSRTQTL